MAVFKVARKFLMSDLQKAMASMVMERQENATWNWKKWDVEDQTQKNKETKKPTANCFDGLFFSKSSMSV